MFDALINGRIDTHGLEFEVGYYDIEELNLRTIKGGTDISKISFAVLPQVYADYRLLDAGSALGRGNGPLVVSHGGVDMDKPLRLAVPGFHTTANLLMERLYPCQRDKYEVLFSEIADAVMNGRFDAGVLIHEGRFTYASKGLSLVGDLGQMWEKGTGLPLPLGGIVASRSLPESTIRTLEWLLRESVEYAFTNRSVSREYIKSHAREMDDAMVDSHIGLFVNEYSVSLGAAGRRAVRELTGVDI